ncbi:MAG: HAD family hydrolase [Deltaproteobacteria bacterium]|nr:HAD family hydrolase [Deltaproteobacteria bacterium]
MTVPASPLRAVLLDYGGTLDGDALHWFDHFLRLYARLGVALTAAALKPAFYGADDAIAHHPEVRGFTLVRMTEVHVRLQLAALGRADSTLERGLVEAFVADTRAAWDRNRPLLQRLAHRFRLGVVSNSYGNMPALLAEAALAPFEIIIDSALVGVRKPDPAIYDLAARRLALPPAAILHAGDSWERDVVPARAVGMRAVWLAPADASTPTAPADVRRIASLLELEDLLA